MNEWRKVEAGHCLWSNENLIIDDEKMGKPHLQVATEAFKE